MGNKSITQVVPMDESRTQVILRDKSRTQLDMRDEYVHKSTLETY